MSTNLKSIKAKQKHASHKHSIGIAPGTITYKGLRKKVKSKVNIIAYNEASLKTYVNSNLDQIRDQKNSQTVSWVNITGLNDELFIKNLGTAFELNPLILEDTVNTAQRPKIDEYDDYIFGVFKMLYLDDKNELITEHIALILLENMVFVFQETEKDVFDGLRQRINSKTGHVRDKGADYLYFAFLDAIIDNYMVVIASIEHQIEELELEVYEQPNPKIIHKIQKLKKDVMRIRKWIYPVKELVNRLIASEHTLITKDTKIFLRDALDHLVEINENLQIYREMSMGLSEMHMSQMSNKMNEIMKVLTIMSSIFIPTTFISSIYGMNFDNMPELHWTYGYGIVWGLMIILFIIMFIYFKKKDWL